MMTEAAQVQFQILLIVQYTPVAGRSCACHTSAAKDFMCYQG